LGDGSNLVRYLPVSANKSGILFSKLIIDISVGGDRFGPGDYDSHTCIIYSTPFFCFFIPFSDSSVCSGNGNKKKIILKILFLFLNYKLF
jgi:hypothetical protein